MRISLGTKFQRKLTILVFWNKLTQGGCFRFRALSRYATREATRIYHIYK